MHLLNIQSSPRGPRSTSIALADAFLQAYRQACPELSIDTLNVWEENLPDFDQEAIAAKYKGVNKEPMDQAETAVWNKIQELAGRFQQANRIVLGVPMWNFAYPYKLTQLIDLACQRSMLFTYDGTEYGPLLKTSRGLVVYARGGTYAEDSLTPAKSGISLFSPTRSANDCRSSASNSRNPAPEIADPYKSCGLSKR